MAEREGFEPSVVLLLHTLSKRADKKKIKKSNGLFSLYLNLRVYKYDQYVANI